MTETPPKEPLRVGVLGARGRMGSETCRAVDAAEDLDLVAMVEAGDWLFGVADAGAQVVVDFTSPAVVLDNIRWCIDQGIHCVVGTTGFDAERLATVQRWVDEAPGVGVVIAPNFAVGAVLTMRFATIAARFFESVEIVELHHPNKVDAPSGTAARTASLVAAARLDAGLGPGRRDQRGGAGGGAAGRVDLLRVVQLDDLDRLEEPGRDLREPHREHRADGEVGRDDHADPQRLLPEGFGHAGTLVVSPRHR
jgi:4-hydroxy-tetrahydrodipicolinate reductase